MPLSPAAPGVFRIYPRRTNCSYPSCFSKASILAPASSLSCLVEYPRLWQINRVSWGLGSSTSIHFQTFLRSGVLSLLVAFKNIVGCVPASSLNPSQVIVLSAQCITVSLLMSRQMEQKANRHKGGDLEQPDASRHTRGIFQISL